MSLRNNLLYKLLCESRSLFFRTYTLIDIRMFKKLLASMGISTVKVGDADWNGSLNIQKLGQLINLPGGSGLACSLEQHVLGLLKTWRCIIEG